MFDRFVDAIIAAAQNAGFVLDRHYFPWKVGDQCREDKGSKNSTCDPIEESRDRLVNDEAQHLGAILFRREQCGEHCRAPRAVLEKNDSGATLRIDHSQQVSPNDQPEILVVSIVAESPTHGIEKCAFEHAVAMIDAYRQGTEAKRPRSNAVHILGPSFSGSAQSLSIAMQQASAHTFHQFEIISGSATSYRAYEVLTRTSTAGYQASFHASVVPDHAMQEAMVHYLLTVLEVAPKDIALLVEQDSSYGQGIIDASLTVNKQRQETLAAGLMVLPFPMNISSIRENVEREQRDKPKPEDEFLRRRGDLEKALELGVPTHVPMDYSRASLVSSELVINHIIAQINRYKFKYVGIASSQPADRIFLARMVRESNPDLTTFFIESDILYSHSDLSTEFFGSLVISTYPLFTRNQIWSFPYRGHSYQAQFPSGTAQGPYNAMLLLLAAGTGAQWDEYHVPLEYGGLFGGARPPSLLERLENVFVRTAEPANASWDKRLLGRLRGESLSKLHADVVPKVPYLPPIWISVVGREDFWPVTTYYPYAPQFVRSVCGTPAREGSPRQEYRPQAQICQRMDKEARRFVAGYDDGRPRQTEFEMELIPPPLAGLFVSLILSLFTALHGATCLLATRVEGVPRADHQVRWLRGIFVKLPRRPVKWFRGTIDRWWCWNLFDLSFEAQTGSARAALYAGACVIILAIDSSVMARWFLGYPFLIGTRFAWCWLFMLACGVTYAIAIVYSARALSSLLASHSPRLQSLGAIGLVSVAGLIVFIAPYRGSFPLLEVESGADDVSRFTALTFFSHRVTDLLSNLSPAIPLLIFGAIGYAWCGTQVMRWRTNWAISQVAFQLHEEGFPAELEEARHELDKTRQRLRYWFYELRGSVLVGATVVFCCWMLAIRLTPTLDGQLFKWVFFAAFSACTGSVSYQILRVWCAWRHIRRFLAALSASPLIHAFQRLPKYFWRDLPTRLLTFPAPRIGYRAGPAVAFEQLRLFVNHAKVACFLGASDGLDGLDKALKDVEEARAGRGGDAGTGTTCSGQLCQEVTAIATADRIVLKLLRDYWASRPRTEEISAIKTTSDKSDPKAETTALYLTPIADQYNVWIRLGEDYLAARFADLLDLLLGQVQRIVAYCTLVLLLLLLTMNGYPFEPAKLVTAVVLIGGCATIATAIIIFVQMNRDEVISRVSGTEGGKVTWDFGFILQLGVYVLFPLIAVFTTQMPRLGRPLAHLFTQIARTLK